VERYVIRGGRAGYERLKVLSRASLPETADLFDRVGVVPGARCLDLGCGSGDVTFELARRAGPRGHATGIDQDEVKLALAREDAEAAGIANAEFRQASVYDWDEPAAYDIVYCRFLLQHLGRPVDLLHGMWAGVRPGGAILVEDADFTGSFSEPPSAGHAFFARAYPLVLERHGGDPLAARKLFRWFLEAGIPGATLSVRQGVHTAGEAKSLPHSTVEATAEAIVGEGIASEEEVEEALADLAAFSADPTTIFGRPRTFQVWARRD
jgi:ubiquinone/menaquinone biosynthesis C-methylase UbiE